MNSSKHHSTRTHFQKFLQKVKRHLKIDEELLDETKFYIYRTDTNRVLARGLDGFEAAKERATLLRKQLGLKWDQVRFKAERRPQQFGVSADGKTFTNAYGQRGRVDVLPHFNSSKGRQFRGYYDKHGNFHDLD